ncbi:MAG TPA: FkbM family methyltransferase [Xanthobacteraceae bacterium]|nr:FkbM family methyltransferase [Xanthobacteraceae bacterium]
MDLYHHDQVPFTRWVVSEGLLHEPFVVVDVGVQGGEHVRWGLLGDQVRVYGFDAISEAIDRITAAGGVRPHRVFRAIAIGNEDGEREFFVPPNTTAASFYEQVTLHQTAKHGDGAPGARVVPIRRLDTLFMAGELPAADYIKTDCESFDPEVLRGARRYLAQSNILSLTVETDFSISGTYPRTPFVEISDIAVQHRLLVFDINAVRHPRPAYVAARERHPWPPADPLHDVPYLDVGQPRTYDFLFCRDFVLEHKKPAIFADVPDAVTRPTTDKLIKAIINFELHGLMDCAVEIADHFRTQLAERLDVDTAVELLARRPPYARNTADVTECIRMIAALRLLNQQSDARLREAQAENRALQSKLAAAYGKPSPVVSGGRLLKELGRRIRRGIPQ